MPDPGLIDEIIDRNVALAAPLDEPSRERLVQLAGSLVAHKRWEGIGGLDLTDEIRVTIAANAAIPILALDPALYRNVQSIIVHRGQRSSTGLRAGPVGGVVADERMSIVGEAAPHSGPLSVSWDTARAESRHPARGRNVVIHEFAHKIDMSDGYSDGTPPLQGQAMARWLDLLHSEYERAAGQPSDGVLRPYAWSSAPEFFAVSTEAFFCTPGALAGAKPALYRALSDFYHQNPAGEDGRRS